jgi:DNA invertase Pin-like site-specific DNA recombinase
MNLTEREIEILRLRDGEGLSWQSIADRLGSSKGAVNSSYRNAKRKIETGDRPNTNTIEAKDPERASKALDAVADPFATIAKAAKECGFPESTIRRFIRRLKVRYQPLDDAVRQVRTQELIQLFEDRASRALDYLDDYAMAGASARDLAVVAGVMVDKARLLKGQPTQILSHEERKNINELIPAVIKEARRRGITIEGKLGES